MDSYTGDLSVDLKLNRQRNNKDLFPIWGIGANILAFALHILAFEPLSQISFNVNYILLLDFTFKRLERFTSVRFICNSHKALLKCA